MATIRVQSLEVLPLHELPPLHPSKEGNVHRVWQTNLSPSLEEREKKIPSFLPVQRMKRKE